MKNILEAPGVVVLETEPTNLTGKLPLKAILQRNHEYKGFDGAWVLKIVGILPEGIMITPGQWYLDTLLGYDGFGSKKRSDIVIIDDAGHQKAGNMLAVLKEAEETVYGKMDEAFVDKYAHIPMHLRNWYQKPEAQSGYEKPRPPKKKRPSEKDVRKMEDLKDEIVDLERYLRTLQSDSANKSHEAEQFSSDIIESYGWDILDLLNSGASDEEKVRMMKEWNLHQDEKGKEIRNPESLVQDHKYYFGEESDKEVEEIEKQIEEKEKELEKMVSMYESLNESSIANDQGPETD